MKLSGGFDGFNAADVHRLKLRPHTFLAQLAPEARSDLLSGAAWLRYPAGTTLFRQGDRSRHVSILGRGWVKVASTARSGWEALLAIRGPGDIVGELSAMDGRPRLATVRSLTVTEIAVLTTERFREFLAERPEVALPLFRHIAANLRQAECHRIEYGASNGIQRLARLLLLLTGQHGVKIEEGTLIDLPFTQQDLGAAVGISREMTARTLRQMRRRRIVLTGRRRIVVTDVHSLRTLAGPGYTSDDVPPHTCGT